MNPNDKTLLQKFTMVAKKIIYDPERMRKFLQMLNSKDGALTAVHTVIGAIDKLKPVPPQIKPLLGVNAYMVMVDLAQEIMKLKPDPTIVSEVVQRIMAETQGAAPEQPQGMLAQMQQGEPAGDPATPDNTPEHENAESPELEQQEGAEEDPAGEEEDPRAGLLARMQRRGVPA